MPPKKNKPKITPGQLRGIIREMNQPPFNARQRKVPRNKPTPKRASGPVKRTQTGIKKTPATIAQERYQAGQMRLQRMAQKLQQPAKRPVPGQVPTGLAKPKVQKPQKSGIRTRARGGAGKGGRLFYTPGKTGRRLVGIDLRQLPRLVQQGIISQSEANTIRNAAEGRRMSYSQAGVSVRDTSNILKRELNLTPGARARLDAEEARLAREEQLSRNKQYEEARRNPKIQDPMKEPAARRNAERIAIEFFREAAKSDKAQIAREKAKRRRQKILKETSVAIDKRNRRKAKEARTTPPRTPRIYVGRGGIPPIMPGGGGGMFQQIQ